MKNNILKPVLFPPITKSLWNNLSQEIN